MLRKTCKIAAVIVTLCLLVNINVSATIGIMDINLNRYSEGSGVISIEIVDKIDSQLVVATLVDSNGSVIGVEKFSGSSTNKIKWSVKSGSYKVILANLKTGEKEVHYAIL